MNNLDGLDTIIQNGRDVTKFQATSCEDIMAIYVPLWLVYSFRKMVHKMLPSRDATLKKEGMKNS